MAKKKKPKKGQPAGLWWDDMDQSSKATHDALHDPNATMIPPSDTEIRTHDQLDSLRGSFISETHSGLTPGHPPSPNLADKKFTGCLEIARSAADALQEQSGFEVGAIDSSDIPYSDFRCEQDKGISSGKLKTTAFTDLGAPDSTKSPRISLMKRLSAAYGTDDDNFEADQKESAVSPQAIEALMLQETDKIVGSSSGSGRGRSLPTAEAQNEKDPRDPDLDTSPKSMDKKDGRTQLSWLGCVKPEDNVDRLVARLTPDRKSKKNDPSTFPKPLAVETPFADHWRYSPAARNDKANNEEHKLNELSEEPFLGFTNDLEKVPKPDQMDMNITRGKDTNRGTNTSAMRRETPQSSFTPSSAETMRPHFEHNRTSSWPPAYHSDEEFDSEQDSWPKYSSQQQHAPIRHTQAATHGPYPGSTSYLDYYPPYNSHLQPYSAQYPYFYHTPYGLEPLYKSQHHSQHQGFRQSQNTSRPRTERAASARNATAKAGKDQIGTNVPHLQQSDIHHSHSLQDVSLHDDSSDTTSQSDSSSKTARRTHKHVPAATELSGSAVSVEGDKKMDYKAPTCEDYHSDESDGIALPQPQLHKKRDPSSNVVVVNDSRKTRRRNSKSGRPPKSEQNYAQPMSRPSRTVVPPKRSSKREPRPMSYHAINGPVPEPVFPPMQSAWVPSLHQSRAHSAFTYGPPPPRPVFASAPSPPAYAPAPSAPAPPRPTSSSSISAIDVDGMALPSAETVTVQPTERPERPGAPPVPQSASPEVEALATSNNALIESSRSEGLVIAVSVQCSHATLHSRFSTLLHQNWPERMAQNDLGEVFVKKAVNAKRFKKRDGSHSIELSCDNGPSLKQFDNNAYQIQWLHLNRCQMDLADFENMCLNAPGISGELRFVVLRLFKHVQDNFRKRFYDGFAIDPGTVLRCDGTSSRSTNNHELSATFVCFPYLSVEPRRHNAQSTTHGYPTKSIMRILYPYESTEDREVAPIFCKNTPHASEGVLYVPQLWAVIVGSKYIVTSADIESDGLLGSSVAIVQALNSMDHIPVIPDDCLPRTDQMSNVSQHAFDEKHVNSEQGFVDIDSNYSHQDSTRTNSLSSVQLFDGMRVEEFLVTDQDPIDPIESTLAAIQTSSSMDFDVSPLCVGQSGTNYQVSFVQHPNDKTLSLAPSMISGHHRQDVGTEIDAPIIFTSVEAFKADRTSLCEEDLAEERNSILSMLSALTEPQMTTQYLEAFQTCLTYILHIWTNVSNDKEKEQLGILSKLEQSIPRAEMLRSMCDLELQGSVFAQHLEYREAMLKALGVKNSSCQNELHSLGDAVQDAINLLKRVSGSGLTAAIRPKIKPRGGEVDKIHIPGQNRSHANGAKHNLRRRNTPPFLTWAWLSSEYDKSVRPERLAAENLFAIMEDIDRNLRRRNEISYTLAMEISLAEWDERISGSQQQLSYISSAHPDSSLLYASTHLSPRIIGGSPSSPRRSIVDFLGEDALLQAQKSAIHAAIDDLSTHAKNFVGLFIPCSYQHAVSKKIWGSLSLLLKSATSSLGDEERERQNYIIRPLDAEFMTSHGIEQPPFALQDCSACRDGHVHKSVQDAVYHLKRVHFKYESRLSELAHLQTTHHHWVRTENQVRNELANKHQLRLLQICLSYLKTLYARAEKIHLGISHDEKTDVVRYQLPNDLVDCFEATALFIMQCATSLIAIEDEMRRWQHVPGLSLEDIKTPVVEYAVERLGELGQAAQSSMTRAEKTLALSDPETNVVSMGATGPELLLLVLFQNLQKKQLLEGIDMDVNQLYQESASKLQYQVNQFPRKRLLRDIHALQEELSVIQVVNSWQQRSFESLVKVLDPHSFENPSPSRVTMFPSESECLTASLKDLDSKITELDALKNRTQYLREQLKQSVEILEEDHGKAILVFTMITTIFLPLSFVTSFFGMNTSDIRNTSRGQDFFWAIAIPVTAGIVFLAVLLAYHGDKLYDAVVQVVHQLRKKRTQRVAQPEHRQLWSKKPLPLHQRSWSLRRHSGFGLKQLDSGAMRLR